MAERCDADGGPDTRVLAGEERGVYTVGRTEDDGATEPGAAAGAADGAPFGLPVLAELPALASVLEHLEVADRAQSAAVVELAALLRDGEVERTTGVGVDHWLAVVGRSTRMDRRVLVRTCRLLDRLPSLEAAVRGGQVSFAQLRGVGLALRGVRRELDGAVDQVIAATVAALADLERPDPDVLVRQVGDAVDELDPDDLVERERMVDADRFLAFQPRLDGTGGRFSGDVGAAGMALLDAATAPSAAQIEASGGLGAARLDLLLARLAASDAPDLHLDASTAGDSATGGAATGDAATGATATGDAVADGPVGSGGAARSVSGRLMPPRLLLRVRFESLVDGSVPAELLTSLVGGRLKLSSRAARRLVDEAGALVRTVVIDDVGEVVGVGRATRRPAGWLADAVAAVHETCTGPGCDRPARTAQLDHAAPWWPTGPEEPLGRTDVDNLGPLCAATNREKEAAGWKVTQLPGGARRWVHARSGMACTTLPSTWRAPNDPRDGLVGHARAGPDPGGGSDPPGPSGTPGPPGTPGTPGPPGSPGWPVGRGLGSRAGPGSSRPVRSWPEDMPPRPSDDDLPF